MYVQCIKGYTCTCIGHRWYRAVVRDVRDKVDSTSITDSTSSDEDVPLHPRCTDVQYFCLFVDYGDWEWVWSNEVEPICKELLEV